MRYISACVLIFLGFTEISFAQKNEVSESEMQSIYN